MTAIYAPTLTARVILPATDPCAGATQLFKLLSIEGTYDAYIDDNLVVADANVEVLLFALLQTELILPSFTEIGLFTSYRPENTQLRLERKDATEILFDESVNPTARTVGNVLTVCLLGGVAWEGGVIESEAAAVTPADPDGFFTLSGDLGSCGDSASAAQTWLLPQTPIEIGYRFSPLVDNTQVHTILDVEGAGTLQVKYIGGASNFVCVNQGDGEAPNPTNIVTFPVPSGEAEVTFTVDLVGKTLSISYVGFADSFAIKPAFEANAFGSFGVVVRTSTAGQPNSCSAAPMTIKVYPASVPPVDPI